MLKDAITDSEETIIFTPENLSYLTEGIDMRVSSTNGTTKKPFTPEDVISRGVFKKRKNHRSSGEIVTIPVPCKDSYTGEYFLNFKSPVGIIFDEYNPERMKTHFRIPEASDEYLYKLWTNLSKHPIETFAISMTHDKKSLTLVSQEISFYRNKHYRSSRILYSYVKSEQRKVSLYKQYRKGTEGFYLRSYGNVLSHGEKVLPDFQKLISEYPILFKKIMAMFLETDLEHVEEVYQKAAYPVSSRVFPDTSNPSHLVLSRLPGWRHKENDTLTKALGVTINGKPRKDFVRAFAENIKFRQMAEKRPYVPIDPSSLSVREALGATHLIALARKKEFNFDMEDFVIKTLHKTDPCGKRTISNLHAFSSSTHGLDNRLVPSFRRHQKETEEQVHYLIAFLGERLFKKIIGNMTPESEIEQRGVCNEYHIPDTINMIKYYSGISEMEGRLITSAFNSNKTRRKEAIEAIRRQVSGARGRTQIADEELYLSREFSEYGWKKDMNLIELHDVLSLYTRMNPVNPRYQELPLNGISETIETLKDTPLNIDEDTYAWIYPESNQKVIGWAIALRNCMASYTDRIQNNEYVLAFVSKNGKPYAALGMKQKNHPDYDGGRNGKTTFSLEQFYMSSNLPLPANVEKKLLTQLKDAFTRTTRNSKDELNMREDSWIM